jgi:hypothetical protein
VGASRVGTRETPAQLLARIRALRVTDATAAVQAPSRPSLRVLARALHENIDVFGRSWEAAVHREGKATTEGRTRRRAALRQSGPLPPSARSASPTTCGESGTLEREHERLLTRLARSPTGRAPTDATPSARRRPSPAWSPSADVKVSRPVIGSSCAVPVLDRGPPEMPKGPALLPQPLEPSTPARLPSPRCRTRPSS